MATKKHQKIHHHKSENPSIEDTNIMNLNSPIKPMAKHLTRYNNNNVVQGGRSLPRQQPNNA